MKTKYVIGILAVFLLVVALLAAGYQISYRHVMDRQASRSEEESSTESIAAEGQAVKEEPGEEEGYYLCELQGLDVNAHRPMPADFLMKQMQWHEMLEAAKATHDERTREALKQRVLEEKQVLFASLKEAFDVKGDYDEAFDLTRKLMFITKLLTEISF